MASSLRFRTALSSRDRPTRTACLSLQMSLGPPLRQSQNCRPLQNLNQINLNAAVALANSGNNGVSFAADGEKQSMYTVDHIKAIGVAAYQWGFANKLYYAYLQKWIKREQTSPCLLY